MADSSQQRKIKIINKYLKKIIPHCKEQVCKDFHCFLRDILCLNFHGTEV